MSELNENVEVTIDDATVVTVPLVENFTATNAAPTAKFVGDALDEKVDVDGIMEAVRITFNGIQSDNQGVILASGDDIPVEDGGTTSISEAINGLDAKTAGEINYTALGGQTIKAKVDGIDAKTASEITYVSGQTIKEKVDAVAATAGNALLKTEQSLTPEEKVQAQTNIGLSLVNNLTAAAPGVGALDAYQGAQLNTALTGLSGNFSSLFRKVTYTYDYTLGTTGNAVYKSVTAADLEMTAIEGYEPIAITSATTASTAVIVIRWDARLNGSYVVTIRNLVTTEDRTGTLTVTVLYARTAAIATD